MKGKGKGKAPQVPPSPISKASPAHQSEDNATKNATRGKTSKRGATKAPSQPEVRATKTPPALTELTSAAGAGKPSTVTVTNSCAAVRGFRGFLSVINFAIVTAVIGYSLWEAYRIRLYPVKKYGRIIHEFDPWFHFRATQYLADNGLSKFFHWFDHRSWYPIGRPIGTTIYPGMQMTAVAIWRVLKLDFWRTLLRDIFSVRMSLNDVCVFIPAWFGSLATLALGLLTREVSGSWHAAAAAAAVMSVLPAHLMRSVAGEFDNECIAMFAMCLTFYLWCRSLRTSRSWWIGALAGVAYAYMAASWGGFVYVCNMVALHAGFLMFTGHRTPALHRAFTLYYIVGTVLAMQIPVVGMTPLRSLEQASALYVFLGLQAFWLCDKIDKKFKLKPIKSFVLRACAVCVGAAVLVQGIRSEYFSPLSIRVHSLFFEHTKTGNPLVDSVAEHQPASQDAYNYFLYETYPLMFVGLGFVALKGMLTPNESLHYGTSVNKYFIILCFAATYMFSRKMSRLILLMAPVASSLAGVVVGYAAEWAIAQSECFATLLFPPKSAPKDNTAVGTGSTVSAEPKNNNNNNNKKKENKEEDKNSVKNVDEKKDDLLSRLVSAWGVVLRVYRHPFTLILRILLSGVLMTVLAIHAKAFWAKCDDYASSTVNPQIVVSARLRSGETVEIRDYYDSYLWLSKHTPPDSRVLAWWDYGYHITGIGNRTSLADGNTWNLEHIATVGRMLASPEPRAYNLTRMMADYVLIWAGNYGDDLSKSPHIARISSSVYDGICDNDPMCYTFGFNSDGTPTKTMAASMLYKMHSNGLRPGVKVNPRWFKEVHRSKYGLVRIYKVLGVDKEAKRWAMDPKNWKCDHPGSWYCPGQYPPGFPKPPSTHKDIDYKKLNVKFDD